MVRKVFRIYGKNYGARFECLAKRYVWGSSRVLTIKAYASDNYFDMIIERESLEACFDEFQGQCDDGFLENHRNYCVRELF